MPDSQHDVTDSAQPDSATKRDSLMDVAEPDDAFLLASEQEDSLAARAAALLLLSPIILVSNPIALRSW